MQLVTWSSDLKFAVKFSKQSKKGNSDFSLTKTFDLSEKETQAVVRATQIENPKDRVLQVWWQ